MIYRGDKQNSALYLLSIEGDALQFLGEEAVEGCTEGVERVGLVDRRQAELDECGEGNDFRTGTEGDRRHCFEWIYCVPLYLAERAVMSNAYRSLHSGPAIPGETSHGLAISPHPSLRDVRTRKSAGPDACQSRFLLVNTSTQFADLRVLVLISNVSTTNYYLVVDVLDFEC